MKGHTNSDKIVTPNVSGRITWYSFLELGWIIIDKGIFFSVVFLSLALGSPVKFKSNLIQFNLNDPG